MEKRKRKLTPKQEKFCLAYIDCGNASEAYRQAYNAEKMKPETIWRKSFDLLESGKVAARINELREKMESEVIATVQDRMQWWTEVMNSDETEMKDRLKASELLGKAQGDFVERREITERHIMDFEVLPYEEDIDVECPETTKH